MSDKTATAEEKIKQIFVKPEVQTAVVNAIVRNKPKGWGRRSNAPYYRKIYAEALKKELDAMMEDRTDRCYHYADFEKIGIGKDSLYLRINQSLHYLLDYMDPIGVYKDFMETIVINRKRGVGVELRFNEMFRDGKCALVPRQVVAKSDAPKWKTAMTEWLESASPGDEPFFRDKLALTPTEIEEIHIMLAPLSGILKSITSHSIKLVKVNVPVS